MQDSEVFRPRVLDTEENRCYDCRGIEYEGGGLGSRMPTPTPYFERLYKIGLDFW